MSNPAFIVDGFTEKSIVEKLCEGIPVKRVDCNGKDVTISRMGEEIASKISFLGNRHYPIIILVDKEDRNISHQEMSEKLRDEIEKALERRNFTKQDLRIGVADRMIENWIIADWDSFDENYTHKPQHTDGCNGKSLIKKVRGEYHETTDGVKYFLAANPDIIYQNSPSYRYFIDQLRDLDCEYLKFTKDGCGGEDDMSR